MYISTSPYPFGVSFGTWAGIAIAVAALAGATLLVLRAPRSGLSRADAFALVLRAVVWGLVGARLLHVVEHLTVYRDAPWLAAYFWRGGFALWGALPASAYVVWRHARRRGMALGPLADAATTPVLLGMTIARVGGLFTGDVLGRASTLPWATVYTHAASPSYTPELTAVHPVALYELVLTLAVLALVRWGRSRPGPDARPPAPAGAAAVFALAAYAVGRFVIGFARAEPALLLTSGQWAAVAAFAFCAWWWRGHLVPAR